MRTPHDLLRDLTGFSLILSSLSAAGGLSLCLWMYHDPRSWTPVILLGLAHAIAFVPLTICLGVSLTRNFISILLCLTFAFWGFSGMMFLTGYGAPLACSLIWGVIIAWTWRRPWALLILPCAGVFTLGAMYAVQYLSPQWKTDWLIPEAIAAWYLAMIQAIPMIVHTKPRTLPKRTGGHCRHCGYALIGLPRPKPCVNCGTPCLTCPECGSGQPA